MARRPLALLATLGLALAQEPAAWSDLPVPNGTANATVSSIGKVVAVVEGGSLQCWSAASRRWHAHAFPAGATLRLANDLVLIVEPAAVTVFSAYTSRFAAIAVSPQAQVVNPGGQNNDSLVFVLDGTTLHAFSVFTGAWVSRTFQGPVAAAVQRHVGIAVDGTLVCAMDAYTSSWHDLTVGTAPQALSCDGMAGLAIAPQEVHAFSALHGAWQSHALTGTPNLVRNDDWALFWDQGSQLAYSALTGGFQPLAIGAVTAPAEYSLCAVAETAAGFVAFSAPRGTWSQVLAPAASRVTGDGQTVLFANGPQLTGYSGATGAAQTIAFASNLEQVAGSVGIAFANATGLPVCFSALTGSFHNPPNDVLAATPVLTTTAALLPSAGGAYAFAARTGTFVPAPIGPGAALVGNPQSSVAAAYDGAAIHAFDGRTNTFVSAPRTSPQPPQVAIWRTSMTVVDGSTAHGYSTQTGRFASTAMPEPYSGGRANSESGRIDTQHHVLAHSGSPTLATFAQFPEFRRVQPLGAPAHFAVALAGGGIAAIAGGVLTGAPLPVPGLGEFRLAAPPLATVFVASLPGEELGRLQLALPPAPGLVGLELGFQALALPIAGLPYLGDATALYLL